MLFEDVLGVVGLEVVDLSLELSNFLCEGFSIVCKIPDAVTPAFDFLVDRLEAAIGSLILGAILLDFVERRSFLLEFVVDLRTLVEPVLVYRLELFDRGFDLISGDRGTTGPTRDGL